jgi:predicted dehydrogenase
LDRVRLGLVGVGNIAPLNVVGYLEDGRCDLVAVADPRIEKARGAAKAWGAERAYPSLEELLADDEIDAVEILTPTHLHHEHVLAALRAGKHVSCQKPFTNTVAESRELAAAAAEAGTYLRVSECFYHYPPLVRAKELVESGVIGDPIGLRIKTVCGRTESPFEIGLEVEGYLWRLDARSPGGHLFDDMIHKFAMVPWLVGKTVTSVRAVVGREDLFYEPFAAILEYDDPRCRAVIDSHYAKDMPVRSSYYGADEFFEIQGTKGFIWVTRCTGELLDLPPLLLFDGEGRQTWDDSVNADWGEGFKGAARHFVDCILAGVQPDMTPDAAIESLQLCFATYESARTGVAVDPRAIEDKVVALGWPT